MTPNDLYAMTPQEVEKGLSMLTGCYYNHLDGSGLDSFKLGCIEADSTRVHIRILKYFCFDGRRIWSLATVWFDGKPIMVIQNAGREGDDHAKRYITDLPGFNEMCAYLNSLLPPERQDGHPDVVAPDLEMGDELIEFYNCRLDGKFEHY